ncbi:bacterio-opsin activator [Haloarcula taiwanensis]|uniref:Bacterio-opsin activator n=1 Tax=Haloarcula taiwanensis TaxID=1932004 RepID=A0A2H4ZYM3_9EURY|nr:MULTISPECIES: helix-turn-helix domain-containing protein [Haloarcula]AUG47583.1 bacterio-opsin activator [Haloarcula taiwanensis]RLM33745.1 bacterio-opsin activator [Haloarcula sp. Atlit-120R]RLM42695.1 bacterio-opsin activator [Haloarcula sp. Atlit-47R]RLM95767.1 bacterio-opsin activator [Haloarcula sp. Atlit-7R]
MSGRMLAEVEVFGPRSCQVQPHADEEWSVSSVSRSATSGGAGRVVEEFTLKGSEGTPSVLQSADPSADHVFAYDQRHVFQLSRAAGQGCVCERIEAAGCVVQEFSADTDSIVVTFLVDDIPTLRDIVDDLESEGETVKLRRLLEDTSTETDQPVVLDRAKLTSRQREVLTRAHEMGYFEHPREATAGDVADALDISTSTFTEHLAAAQRKLLDDLLDAR